MPACRAASRTLVPAATSTCTPSIVSLGTGSAPDQRLELVAELLDVADVGTDRAIVERADRRAGAALGHVEDRVEVFLARLAVDDAVGHLVDPARRLTARRALATGLVGVEARDDHQRLGDRHGLVEHDHAG